LARALAQALALRLERYDDGDRPGAAPAAGMFVHPDAVGGGSEIDLHNCLMGLLGALDLEDGDTGIALLHVYHYVCAEDLPLSPRTWRPLLLAALTCAVEAAVGHSKEAEAAKLRLQRNVAHWWSSPFSDRALEAFTSRPSFQPAALGRSSLAALYFELRERSLQLVDSDCSSTSAASVSEYFAPLVPAPIRVESPVNAVDPPIVTPSSMEGSLVCSRGSSDAGGSSSLDEKCYRKSPPAAKARGQRRHLISL